MNNIGIGSKQKRFIISVANYFLFTELLCDCVNRLPRYMTNFHRIVVRIWKNYAWELHLLVFSRKRITNILRVERFPPIKVLFHQSRYINPNEREKIIAVVILFTGRRRIPRRFLLHFRHVTLSRIETFPLSRSRAKLLFLDCRFRE